MNAPRMVTLATLDHGPVTVPCPIWCTGHADHVPVHRVDLGHAGGEQLLEFRGEEQWIVMLTQHPFASVPGPRAVGVYVEQAGYAHTLDPAGLDALAASLVEQAAALRHRARELSAILAGGSQ